MLEKNYVIKAIKSFNVCSYLTGHGNTQGLMRGFDDVFTHSTLERAMFLQDFLDTLGIEKYKAHYMINVQIPLSWIYTALFCYYHLLKLKDSPHNCF